MYFYGIGLRVTRGLNPQLLNVLDAARGEKLRLARDGLNTFDHDTIGHIVTNSVVELQIALKTIKNELEKFIEEEINKGNLIKGSYPWIIEFEYECERYPNSLRATTYLRATGWEKRLFDPYEIGQDCLSALVCMEYGLDPRTVCENCSDSKTNCCPCSKFVEYQRAEISLKRADEEAKKAEENFTQALKTLYSVISKQKHAQYLLSEFIKKQQFKERKPKEGFFRYHLRKLRFRINNFKKIAWEKPDDVEANMKAVEELCTSVQQMLQTAENSHKRSENVHKTYNCGPYWTGIYRRNWQFISTDVAEKLAKMERESSPIKDDKFWIDYGPSDSDDADNYEIDERFSEEDPKYFPKECHIYRLTNKPKLFAKISEAITKGSKGLVSIWKKVKINR